MTASFVSRGFGIYWLTTQALATHRGAARARRQGSMHTAAREPECWDESRSQRRDHADAEGGDDDPPIDGDFADDRTDAI